MAFIDPDSNKGFIDPDAPAAFKDPDEFKDPDSFKDPDVVAAEAEAKPIVAPKVDVSIMDSAPKMDTEFNPMGVLSAADFVLGAIPFTVGAVGTLGYLAVNGAVGNDVTKESVTKARQFGTKLAQKLQVAPEGAEKMPGEYLAGLLGRGEQYKRSAPAKALNTISEAMEATAEEAEKQGVMTKDQALVMIDSAMLFAPMLRRSKARPIEGMTDNASKASEQPSGTTRGPFTPPPSDGFTAEPTRRTTDQGVEVPIPTVDPKKFDDSIYSLDTLYKQDLTEAIKFDQLTKEMGIDLNTKEKFRRYDEGQAKGNELIDNQISNIQKSISLHQAENSRLFKEYDYRSPYNPEGTVRNFRELPEVVKDTIGSNGKVIKELRDQVNALIAKRGTRETLNASEASIYSQLYLPKKLRIKELTQELIDRGLAKPVEFTDDFAPRRIRPKEKSFLPEKLKTVPEGAKLTEALKIKASNVKETLKSAKDYYVESFIGKDYTETEAASTYQSDAASARSYFTLEHPRTKKRTTVALGEETERGTIPVTEFRNKKPIVTYEVPKELFDNPNAKILGRTLREATIDEIKLNVGQKNSINYNAVLDQRIAELNDQLRKDDWVKELVNSPRFKEIGIKLADHPKWKDLPEGFRTLKYTNKMPQLREYAFENRFAEILDDYNKPNIPNPVIRATNTLLTNMMLIPVTHMHNELGHWALTRGVSGFINPVRLGKMLTDFPKAWSEVLNRGELYQQLLKEGGSIMSANVRNTAYLEDAFKQSADVLAKTPQFKQIAALLGRTPADLYEGLSKFSNKSMWTVRDVLYTQLIMEKMRTEGVTLKEAIDSVERHMPNYRLSSRIGETPLGAKLSRKASQFLGNRNLFLFARYHHGMVNSFLNTVKDVAMLDKSVRKSEQFKSGVDSALAGIVAMAVVYPMLDQIAEVVAEVFDTEGKVAEAKVRRPGVLHIFDGILEIAEGKKDPYSVATLLVTPNPVMQAAFELAINKELYNSQTIYNTQSPAGTIMQDIGDYLARRVPQVGQAMKATDEDYGTGLAGVVLRNFFDIRTKTMDQIRRERDQAKRLQEEAKNKERRPDR